MQPWVLGFLLSVIEMVAFFRNHSVFECTHIWSSNSIQSYRHISYVSTGRKHGILDLPNLSAKAWDIDSDCFSYREKKKNPCCFKWYVKYQSFLHLGCGWPSTDSFFLSFFLKHLGWVLVLWVEYRTRAWGWKSQALLLVSREQLAFLESPHLPITVFSSLVK